MNEAVDLALSDAELGNIFVETLIRNEVTIPHPLVNLALKNAGANPMDEDMVQCLLGNPPASPKFHPPNLYCGANMSPHQLPYLLYGEHQGETRVYLGGNISPDIDDIQVCKQLLNNLVSEFKQQHGLELIHLASCIKGKGANAYGMQKFGFGKLFRLFCKKCSNVKCHSIVIKGSFPSKEAFIENGRVGYLRVNQVWFHTKSCRIPDHEENN